MEPVASTTTEVNPGPPPAEVTVTEIKPGLKTTELILAVAVLAIAGAMVIIGDTLQADQWVELAKWVVGGYALSRGLAKL